jgi:hypothetical protein
LFGVLIPAFCVRPQGDAVGGASLGPGGLEDGLELPGVLLHAQARGRLCELALDASLLGELVPLPLYFQAAPAELAFVVRASLVSQAVPVLLWDAWVPQRGDSAV